MSPSTLRERFLAESSQLLSATSPSVAAALTVERFAVQDTIVKGRSKHQEIRCLACGGANVKLRTIWPKHNTRQTSKKEEKHFTKGLHQQRRLIRVCQTCKRVVKHTFPGPVKPKPAETIDDGATKNDSIQPNVSRVDNKDAMIPLKSGNTSSKRRAKTRREGLQALLDKSKQDIQPTRSFSLTDFMRPN